jgi:hypothetical protein
VAQLGVPAHAAERPPDKTPMPEPLIGESITDIDRSEAGELEIDFTVVARRTRLPTLNVATGAIELEWGVTRHLGLAFEVGVSKGLGPDSASVPFEPGLRAAAAWGLFHDFAHDIHLQLESSARVLSERNEGLIESEDSPMRASVDLRGGARQGQWTLRSGIGVGFGGHSRHAVPIRANLAVFSELRPSAPIGFVGLEVDGDWGRRNPVFLAPTMVFGSHPFRLGFGILTAITDVGPSPGILVRLIYEPG